MRSSFFTAVPGLFPTIVAPLESNPARLNMNELKALSDEALWLRFAREDDDLAFTVVEGRFRDRLHAFAAKHIREESGIEDLIQKAWIRAINAKGSFDPAYRLSTWLHQIVINLASNTERGARRNPVSTAATFRTAEGAEGFEILGARSTDDPDAMMRERQIRRELKRAVKRLAKGPPRKAGQPQEASPRRVFILRAMGYSNEETAQRLNNAPVGSIKAKAKRARLVVLDHMRPLLER